MIEVFITNIRHQIEAESMLKILENRFPNLKINFDLEGSQAPFPCGHTILRAVGTTIDAENIIFTLHQSGFMCAILEDKVCI